MRDCVAGGVLLTCLAAAAVGCGGSTGDGIITNDAPEQKVGNDCYFRVISAITPARLREEGVRMNGSVNLTMMGYVTEACDEAPPSESVDSVAGYAIDKAVIDQSGF